ncbi:MAG: TonB-dependent receptor domain-containing protein [Sphingomonadaceae bacterium]
MRRSAWFKSILGSGTAVALALPGTTMAQTSSPQAADDEPREILVTGSRIKRDPNDSALPIQIVSTQDLSREGISSAEQLISYLSTNGNGADNLASNSDVVNSGPQRGTNGLSAANLRGQGSASTLVLLNGRRVAAHGLTGSAVDVNQIPFAAIDRIEILKDGASAIYGTDAIGGVINFITKTNFQGLSLNGFTDITEKGDAPIYRLSATGGYGDLSEQGFNIMATVGKSWVGALNGTDRSFVNGNQPGRGLSIDTRGTPIATAFATGASTVPGSITNGSIVNGAPVTAGTLLSGVSLIEAGATTPANGGINILDLPGGAGCTSMPGGMPYDEQLWINAAARYACAWDTAQATVLQQPIETLTYYARGTVNLGSHQIFAEVTGSDAQSAKRFSPNQYSGNTGNLAIAYPLNATTAATYNDVYNRLLAVFPAIAANYGKPIAYRWRCLACGPREYTTDTNTFRAALGIEGPLFGGWDYRAGASYARSKATSELGSGYHFRGTFLNAAAATGSGIAGAVSGAPDPRAPTAPGATQPGIVGLLNSGILNPFSLTQSAAALAGLDAISARGTTLYGGKYEVRQFDASVSGPLFALPGGDVQVAIGVDYRRETYSFDGSAAATVAAPDIFNVAFDNVNALLASNRDVKAAYGEILFPIFKMLEVTVAGRIDEYSGFGSTVNPKVSAKFRPFDWLLFRGSYNTGFRVPTFSQIFNGVTQSPSPGNNVADPTTCPGAIPNPAIPGCALITFDTLTGGNLTLGPETSKQFSVGVVFQPSARFSAAVDFWSINVDDVIGSLTTRQLLDNFQFFPERFIRDASGTIILLDLRNANTGSRRTQGLEVALRGGFDLGGGVLTAGLDGTYLLKKKEKLLPAAPFGPSQLGVFSFQGDLGLKWKHSAYITYATESFSASFSQIYRDGYANQKLPGILNGSVTRPGFNERVEAYIIYNASVSARFTKRLQLTFGIKNIFDTDPPFAINYDTNTGAGGSWEPRVADPRGRAFTLSADVNF